MKDICPSIECITVMPAAVNALADGNARVKFTAFYDDGLNLISTPTPEIVVNWMVDLNGGTLSSNTTRTNIYGETDITLQSVTAGLATVTATLNSNPKIFGSANVIFNSFEQNNFLKLVAIPQDSAPGDMVELNCYVQNDGDEPIDDIDIIWSTTDGFLTINEGKTNAIGMARNSLMHTNYGGVGVTVNIKNTDISALILIRYFNAHIFPEVLVPNAIDDGILDEYDIAQGVQAMIRPYLNAQPGDLIRFYWGNSSLSRFYDGSNLPWIIDVSNSFNPLDVLSDGIYIIRYEIHDIFNNISYSAPKTIEVIGGYRVLPTLPRPQLANIIGDTINLDMAIEGVLIIIPTSPFEIKPGDTYIVELKVSTLAGESIGLPIEINKGTIINNNQEVIYTIPLSKLEGFDNVKGEFYYKIIKPGIIHALLSHSTDVFIDTVPPHLNS